METVSLIKILVETFTCFCLFPLSSNSCVQSCFMFAGFWILDRQPIPIFSICFATTWSKFYVLTIRNLTFQVAGLNQSKFRNPTFQVACLGQTKFRNRTTQVTFLNQNKFRNLTFKVACLDQTKFRNQPRNSPVRTIDQSITLDRGILQSYETIYCFKDVLCFNEFVGEVVHLNRNFKTMASMVWTSWRHDVNAFLSLRTIVLFVPGCVSRVSQ